MGNVPPSPARLKYLKREIAKRYSVKRIKPGMAALRIKELHKLIRGRYADNVIPNSPAGRDLVTVVAHHLAGLPHDPRRTVPAFIEQYARWYTFAELDALVREVITTPIRWKADNLGWRLRLSDADRTALRITTIGAIDVSKSQRAMRRKLRQNENCRKWRAKQKCKL